MLTSLQNYPRLFVKQAFELAEIFNFETRNKYRIRDEGGRDVAYAAEQQKGIVGFLFRQFLGHWRSFDIHFFGLDRREFLIARHPFRWYFKRIEVSEPNGRAVGVIERRFSFLSKRFEVQNPQGMTYFEVSSPIWRIWTFPFKRQGTELARISKKWTGLGFEMFTDKDTFLVDYISPALSVDERALVLVAAVYVDLAFFEDKAND